MARIKWERKERGKKEEEEKKNSKHQKPPIYNSNQVVIVNQFETQISDFNYLLLLLGLLKELLIGTALESVEGKFP